MCVILVIMAVTSTGASQIIAVTSVLVYDVYQFYLKVGERMDRWMNEYGVDEWMMIDGQDLLINKYINKSFGFLNHRVRIS